MSDEPISDWEALYLARQNDPQPSQEAAVKAVRGRKRVLDLILLYLQEVKEVTPQEMGVVGPQRWPEASRLPETWRRRTYEIAQDDKWLQAPWNGSAPGELARDEDGNPQFADNGQGSDALLFRLKSNPV